MSNREADESVATAPGIGSLESAVGRLIAEVRRLRRAVAEERERAERGEELLREFAEGSQDPVALSARLAAVEAENDDLRGRVARGRERVDQMLASIRFLENRR